MSKNQDGFIPFLILFVVAALAGFALIAQASRLHQTPKIQGLEIARGDESGGDSSGGSNSGSSSGGSGSNTTSGSSNTTTQTGTAETHKPEATEKPEAIETPHPKETAEPKETLEPFNLSEDGTEIESSSISAKSNFPLTFNKTTNTLTVTTGEGEKEIRILPHQAAQIATTSGVQTQIQKIELNQGTSSAQPVFTVTGFKNGKLFGFINISQPVETQIDAQTGQVISSTQQSFIFNLLAPFITQ